MVLALSNRFRIWADQRVLPIWPLFRATLLIAGLALLNFAPRHLGVLLTLGQPRLLIPLFGPEFRLYLPWLNASIGLALATSLGDLLAPRRQITLALADLAADLFGVGVLAQMLLNGPVIGIDLGATLAEHAALILIPESALPSLSLAFDLMLALLIAMLLLRAGRKVFILLTKGL
jgi:hypothetical protein